MYDLDPEGLEVRSVGVKKRKPKGHFTTNGSYFVHSVNGHDKLMGYQNCTYPLPIHGCNDKASRKPTSFPGSLILPLYETRTMASYLQMDKGNETGTLATMHALLRRHHGDETVIYGPSTSN